MRMDWTKDRKGEAHKEDEDDFFALQKAKILAQIQARLSRDRSHLLCSITGNPKTGKTGLVLDSRTDEQIAEGKKIYILDFDRGAEPTWDAAWDRDENIVIFDPIEMRPDGSTNWESTFKNASSFCQLAKETLDEEPGSICTFVLDGVDKAFEGSSDVLRELLVKQQTREGTVVHATDSVKVSTLDWKIRNRVYNRLLDLVCNLECDRFLITHMKPLYDNINVPTPIGHTPDWHKSTPARFVQMIHIRKEVKRLGDKEQVNYIAKLDASKTNPSLVGNEWTIFVTNGDNEWFGIQELREGKL